MTSGQPTLEINLNQPTQITEYDLFLVDETDRFEQEEITANVQRDRYTGRIIAHGTDGSDANLKVSFSIVPVFNKLKSHQAGHAVYVDQPFITIHIPGRQDLTVHTPVTEYYKWRFPLDWKAFNEGRQGAVSGTPLSVWPKMAASPSLVKELEYNNVHTLEQLANLPDGTAMAHLQLHKREAAEFLATLRDKESTGLLKAQLEESSAMNAAMQKQIDELKAMIVATQTTKPSKNAKQEP